jgi:hypothetical protein
MIESNSVEVGSGDLFPTATGSSLTPALLADTTEWLRSASLALLIATALGIRLVSLGASGFSEDEIHKLQAVTAYDHFDLSANAEHPMLMKLACWTSMSAARWWNRHHVLGATAMISPEAAIRAPNAIVGGATALVLVLLGELLFNPTVGWLAGLFWTFDPNAVAINRIGKEDTFLVFFLLLATYLYERGKTDDARSRGMSGRWYNRSAVAFGLMLASKYMPHYFGLHSLFNVADNPDPEDKTPDKRWSFFLTMGAAFLVANFALLLPPTWRYLAAYAHGNLTIHSGYFFAHRLYVNTIEATPWGLPPTFYLTFIATKVPVVFLVAAAGGLVWSAGHPTHRGATFIRVFLIFTLLPYSLVASKFLRYMLPVLAVVDLAAAVGLAWLLRALNLRRLAMAAVVTLVVGQGAIEQAAAAPFYGLAQNAIGGRLYAPGALFPDDEFYDAGVREAVAAIAAHAQRGAVISSDAAAVVSEYLAENARSDMESRSLSHDGIPMKAAERWAIVQDGHIYFENAAMIAGIRQHYRRWLVVRVAGAVAAEVYLLEPDGEKP